MKKDDESKNNTPKKSSKAKQGKDTKKGSILLDRYIQKTTMDKMQHLDDKALADAIKTLLLQGKEDPKNLN